MNNDTISKAIIEAVKDDGGSKGKFGWQHKIGIKVGGEWYGGWTAKSAEDQGLEVGRLVSFEATENGQYKNFVAKTLKVSKSTEPAPSGAAAAGKPTAAKTDYQAGVKVGHAINNAVALAIAAKTTDIESIGKLAISILKLSKRLEDAFPTVMGAAKPEAKPKPEPKVEEVEEVEEEEEEAAPPPPPKATKPKVTKPKAVPPPPAPEADDGFDDDIPF